MKGKNLSLLALVAVLLGAGLMTSAPKAMAGDGDFNDNDFRKEVRVKVDRDFDHGLSAAAIHNLMAGHGLAMMPGHAFGLVGDNDFKKEVRIKVERDNDNDFRDFADNDFRKEVRVRVDNDRDFDRD